MKAVEDIIIYREIDYPNNLIEIVNQEVIKQYKLGKQTDIQYNDFKDTITAVIQVYTII